ncbi:hypothetical protein N7462_000991 [Penicillium macrosclerotiorum]|uniref:uncharacterized protein n=1 Tax=Penicillium macrosclerotiorum TaxID=303699 RepID=UPI00254960C5|nr:uncharacterized protein N7462_000991 [Penicillium macrosclerotiorum]KAJ5698986.1 hypothetical protein N7462_000991 [Penicillium macrosclerotiorum]
MRVPTEILRRIIQDAGRILPIRDLMSARLVNSKLNFRPFIPTNLAKQAILAFFADEIIALIKADPRKSLRYMVELHSSQWSLTVHRILDLPNERLTPEDDELLIDKLIDAWLCGHRKSDDFGHPEYSRARESIEKTLQVALMTSAITRGNCTELQALIDQGVRLDIRSDCLCLVPIDIAIKKGSGDITRVIIANESKLIYELPYLRGSYSYTNVISVAARSGNIEGLKVWIQYLRDTGKGIPEYAGPAFRSAARIGRIDVIEFLEEECGSDFNQTVLLHEMLMQGIVSGSVDSVRYFLLRLGNDAEMWTSPFPKGGLIAALQDCPPTQRPEVLNMLLQHGLDPNMRYPGSPRTPLQVALKRKDSKSALVLLKHGATVDLHSMGSAFFLDAKKDSAPLARIILREASIQTFEWKGKRYVAQKRPKEVRRIENIMLELGWSNENVEEAQIEYYILEYP